VRSPIEPSPAVLAVVLAPMAALAASQYLGWRLPLPTLGSALLSLVLAPLIEEWVMRSLLQSGLLQAALRAGWNTRAAETAAALGAALAFAAAHVQHLDGRLIVSMLGWAVPGLVLAWLWSHRHRTLDCVLLHAYFNACMAAASRITYSA